MRKHRDNELVTAQLADGLLAAWESGDPRRLEATVQRVASALRHQVHSSSLDMELQEALLSVVQRLQCFLREGEATEHHNPRQLQVCYELLRHLRSGRDAAAAMGLPDASVA